MIQHIYFGVDLAIKMGAGLHIIRDGSQYAGFLLEGDELQVIVKNRTVRSLEPHDLQSELQKLNSHAEAVRKIYELLIELPRFDGDDEEISQEGIRSNPRMLRKMIQSRAPEVITTVKEKLNELIEDLKYTQTYWPINQETITRFLGAMSRLETTIDLPMYIHSEVLCGRSSNILEYLSVFGGQAPSIFHGNSVKQIARPESVDPNLELIGGRRAVPHIPFIKKGLVAASADWAAVWRNKAFRYTAVNAKSKGQGVAGFSSNKGRDGVIANPSFEGFYALLRQWIYSNNSRTVGSSARGKRRAQDDDEEMVDVTKRARFTFL